MLRSGMVQRQLMDYKNFDLSLESVPGGGYQVKVKSDMGEAYGVFTLSPECLKFAEELKNIEALPDGSTLPMSLGLSLHQCLFHDNVGDMLNMCVGDVLRDDEKGIRIRLALSPPELAVLPWEVLYDQRTKCYLSTSGKTPLTRYINLFEPIRYLKIAPPVKVLAVIPGGSGLDVEKEEKLISDALKELGSVHIDVLKEKVTRAGISRALVEEQYHILHFIGHGTFENGQGYLLINTEDDDFDLVSADIFADFFRNYASLKLVVLNACQGAEVSSSKELAGMAPQLVSRGIPAVVAMQYPISDDAALVFAKEFYLKLCSGWSRGQVDTAVSHARNRIHMDVKEPMAFATPVLFMRSPTGIIFDLEHEPERRSGIFQRFTNLFTSAPVKNVSRLRQLKETYEKNIEVWQEKTKDASPETMREASEAIAREKEEITGVEERIVKWNKTFVASLLATFVIFLLGYAGLFNIFHADDWLETKFIPYMDEFLPKKFNPNVKLIMAEQGKNGDMGEPDASWRQYHASLVDALTKAGAKVIVFDLELNGGSPFDKQFADAITRAEAQGTHVILGKGVDEYGVITADIPEELKQAAGDEWGNYDVGGVRHGGMVRVYQLAQPVRDGSQSREKSLVSSLSLQAVSGFLAANSKVKAFYSEDRERIQLRSDGNLLREIPVYENKRSLYDFPFDLAERAKLANSTSAYGDVYTQRENIADLRQKYEGKIVLIGFKTAADTFSVLQAEYRYGAEIHANVVSNILEGIYVQLLPASYDFLIVAIMAGFGALVQARFSHVFSTRVKVPLTEPRKTINVSGLLIAADIVYLLVAFLLYRNKLIFILKTYHLFAPFIAYWLTGKMRKKTALKSLKGVTS